MTCVRVLAACTESCLQSKVIILSQLQPSCPQTSFQFSSAALDFQQCKHGAWPITVIEDACIVHRNRRSVSQAEFIGLGLTFMSHEWKNILSVFFFVFFFLVGANLTITRCVKFSFFLSAKKLQTEPVLTPLVN